METVLSRRMPAFWQIFIGEDGLTISAHVIGLSTVIVFGRLNLPFADIALIFAIILTR